MATISGAARTAALALLVAAGSTAAGAASASAAPAVDPPSSCRPANHTASIRPDDPSAGHRHYRVTLTAAPGYAPCTLDGTPGDVVFTLNGSPNGVTATPEAGPSPAPVTLAPGAPVHFDVQVPNGPTPVSTEGVTFTLPGVAGQQEADGYLTTAPGTQVGPIEAGA